MGLFLPHGRHRGGDGQSGVKRNRRGAVVAHGGSGDRLDGAVLVDGWAGAVAAATASARTGHPVTLLPAAGSAVGPAWMAALIRQVRAAVPDATVAAVYDVGPRPGGVMAALRCGWRTVLYTGDDHPALSGLAEAHGARLYRRLGHHLMLDPKRSPVDAVADWLCRSALQSDPGCTIPTATRKPTPAQGAHPDL